MASPTLHCNCISVSCRIVTIGPMVLLGLLGITFCIGVRSTRPGLYTETFGTSPWRFMTLNEVSVPAQIYRRNAELLVSREVFASPLCKLNTTSDESRIQCRVLSQRGLISTGEHLPNSSGSTFNIQRNWSLSSRREAEVAGTSFSRAGFNQSSFGTSTQSIRGVSEAGPGKKTDSEQVTNRLSRGGSRPDSRFASYFGVLIYITCQTRQSGCHLTPRGTHQN